VTYPSHERPGTIIVDPGAHFLYLVQRGGQAIRYGVGVGSEGFGWSGMATVHSKQEWPDWYRSLFPRMSTLIIVPERQKTLEALGSQLVALSRSRPVLMIFEDAHWADPTSLEAFGRAVDRIETNPVLLLINFRPEFEPPWIGRSHVTTPLTLNRFGEHEIAAMIDGVAKNKPLPANIRRDIVERADGIPLFIEEITKAVLEAESEDEARQTAAAIPSPARAVPASLHASLMSRLDRLGPAKELAQTGAAIGREFSHALLAGVVRKPEAELASALDRLIAAGLLFRQGVAPNASYLFKHALVQDAAYGTLLREARSRKSPTASLNCWRATAQKLG